MSITRIPLLIAIIVALGGPALAQPAPPSPEDLEKAKAAYLEGRRLIDEEKNIEAGVAKFKESYRLSRNPLLLYNIGVAFDQLDQKTLALFYYKKFLEDAPAEAPNRDLATERAAVLEKEAADEEVELPTGGGTTKTPPKEKKPPSPFDDDAPTGPTPPPKETTPKKVTTAPDDTPPPRKAVSEFQHMVVEEAPPGRPLDLTAFIPEGVSWQVSLYYRPSGQIEFKTVAMKERYSELVGRIPAEAMQGSSIQYYLEARDRQNKVVARSGRSTSPNLVLIDESARPRFYPDLEGGGATDPGAGAANLGGGSGSAGPTDDQRDLGYYLKWGSTATAGGALTLAVTFYFIASDANSSLEGEAFNSLNEGCAMGPPCRSFGDDQKGLESRGKTFETLTNVMLVTGVVAAGAAGYFWYKDLKRKKDGAPANKTDVAIVPILSDELVGGAAAVRF